MKIGMCMLLWTTEVTADHAPLLRDIRATGFDGVEVPIFGGDAADYAALGTVLNRMGLERTAVAAMGDPSMNLIGNAEQQARGVAHMRHVIDCADALGARLVCGPVHSTLGQFSGQGPTAQELSRSVAAQREIGAHAEGRGVTVALEALNRFECYLVNTMADLAAHIDAIGHPNIRAMYDTFHSNIEESDPVAAFSDHLPQIAHVHLSENTRGVPGQGNVRWDETFAAIRASGYDGWLTIEAFGRALPDLAAATKVWRDFAPSPEAVYREGHAFIRRHLDAATSSGSAFRPA